MTVLEGQRFAGRYRIEGRAGRGGVAEVFRAFDEREQRPVALKCLVRQENPRTQERLFTLFRHEFSILTQVAHPHVVQVYDFGFADGSPYYTMELLDGEPLSKLAPLPADVVSELLLDLCAPLAVLHSRRWVHRDLSPRNVIRTKDGRIKLIDFGATVSMDERHSPVGTPPYMAPEVLRQEALDARADVFSLGALGYFALTGSHAYAVRTLVELPKAWTALPSHPRMQVAGVPDALNELIMEMLHVERAGRPRSMAEVIHRLRDGARDSMGSSVESARAHLDTPRLVGRDAAMQQLRALLESANNGRGGVCSIVGEQGFGRTRLLDELGLEARTRGHTVVRVGARALGVEPLSLARAIANAASQALGSDVESATRLALAQSAGASDTNGRQQIATEQAALVDWLRARSERTTIALLVDDADAADAASQKLLVQLAIVAKERRLLVAVALSASSHDSIGPAQALREHGTLLELEPLTAEEVEAWVRSVFGDVHNVARLTRWLYPASEGKPAACMALAKYLVDHGVAIWTGGMFRLPDSFEGLTLPSSLRDALNDRLAALGPAARRFLGLLAVEVQPMPLEIADYLDAFDARTGEASDALTDLTSAQVLWATADGYVLRDATPLEWAREQLAAGEREGLHRLLAQHYQASIEVDGGGGLAFVCYHLWKAGDIEAADALFGDGRALQRPPSERTAAFTRTDAVVGLYEALLAHRKRNRRSPAMLFALRSALVQRASNRRPDLAIYADETLQSLLYDIGFDLWDTLPTTLSDRERVEQCLKVAGERYASTPKAERGFPPQLSLRFLAGISTTLTGLYGARYEPERTWALLRIMSRFRGLSPAFDIVADVVESSARGQGWSADSRELQQRIVVATSDPRKDLDELLRTGLNTFYSYYLGLQLASEGSDDALSFAPVLEESPLHAALGLQIRRTHALMTGRYREAQRYRRQRELLVLQSETSDQHLQMSLLREQQAAFTCGDLLELARYASAIRSRAREFPGWRPWAAFTLARQHSLVEEYSQALALVDAELAQMTPFSHGAWPNLRTVQAEVLIETSDFAGALAVARDVLDRMSALGITIDAERHLRIVVAVAKVGLGDAALGCEELRKLLEAAAVAPGRQSVVYGTFCEARCRVALMMCDEAAFAEHLQPLTTLYKHHPALRARYERLQRRAREQFSPVRAPVASPQLPETASDAPNWAARLSTALATQNADNQADYLLSLLLSEAECELGQLYRIDVSGRPMLLASRPQPPDPTLLVQATRCCETFGACDLSMTRSMTQLEAAAHDCTGVRYEAVWLLHPEDSGRLEGMLLLPAEACLPALTLGLKQAVSQQLRMLG